jgi:hypothetical protein
MHLWIYKKKLREIKLSMEKSKNNANSSKNWVSSKSKSKQSSKIQKTRKFKTMQFCGDIKKKKKIRDDVAGEVNHHRHENHDIIDLPFNKSTYFIPWPWPLLTDALSLEGSSSSS